MTVDDLGRVSDDTGLSSSTGPASGSGPTGFDPSRKQAVYKAIMRSHAIAAASERAIKAESAAVWFGDYGKNCIGKDAAGVTFDLFYASHCVGSKQATEYIREAIYALLPEIVATAQDMADRHLQQLLDLIPPRDSDEHRNGEDAQRLSGEAMPARPEGIAQPQSQSGAQ